MIFSEEQLMDAAIVNGVRIAAPRPTRNQASSTAAFGLAATPVSASVRLLRSPSMHRLATQRVKV
jgi:hypothetical protein